MLYTLWDTGIGLRCPVCEQGSLFSGWFQMHRRCPHCGARFERDQGEVSGGMTISILATSLTFLVGFFVTDALFAWALWAQLVIWIAFVVLFPVFFYRYSRALWVALLHLAGRVYWDNEPYEESQHSILDAFRARPQVHEGEDDDQTG
jgi:uncharacterized protein (DUF983 family)